MRTLIVGGTIQTPTKALTDHTLIVEDGMIAAIVAGTVPAASRR